MAQESTLPTISSDAALGKGRNVTRTVAATILIGLLASTLVFATVSRFTDDPGVVTAQGGEQQATPAGVPVPQHEAIAAVPKSTANAQPGTP